MGNRQQEIIASGINECVELAKTFGATDGHKYINGVLDKLAKSLRSVELSSK